MPPTSISQSVFERYESFTPRSAQAEMVAARSLIESGMVWDESAVPHQYGSSRVQAEMARHLESLPAPEAPDQPKETYSSFHGGLALARQSDREHAENFGKAYASEFTTAPYDPKSPHEASRTGTPGDSAADRADFAARHARARQADYESSQIDHDVTLARLGRYEPSTSGASAESLQRWLAANPTV